MAAIDDEQLIRYLLRETSPEEDSGIRAWLEADPANRKQFSKLESIWNTSLNLLGTRRADPDLAWERFRARRDAQPPKQVKVRKLYQHTWLKYAAAVLVMLAGWATYSYLKTDYATVLTASNTASRTLPDGSRITMNRNSSLSYPEAFNGEKRSVTLDSGEVFFNVTPDKKRPFVVHAEDITVQVVGTSFNIKHTRNTTEVLVETGIVEVSGKGDRVLLHRGEKVTIKGPEGHLVRGTITDNLHNYYRSRKFTADNTPLRRIVEKLNEAYQADIVLQDPELNDLRLTTTFSDSSLDTILQVLAETFGLKIEKNGRQVILRK
ncbi:MAG TPA: FecR domain-containing protein [Sphingobacteriaceae bacterium]